MRATGTLGLRPASAPRLLLALAALLVFAGCATTLIAGYDEHVESAVLELQPAMDKFLTGAAMAPEDATFVSCKRFYADYAIKVRTTLMWARSHPKNEETVQQLELMLENVEALRSAHESAPLDPEACVVFRDLFNQGWTAILTLEMAKKRG